MPPPQQRFEARHPTSLGLYQRLVEDIELPGPERGPQVQLQAPQISRRGQTITSTITYTATVKNNFGQMFRTPTTTFGNTVTATADHPS